MIKDNGFAYGVDLGWVSQLESRGIGWVDENRASIDPYVAYRNMGADAVRLRVFVRPPESAYWQKRDGSVCMLGFCDKNGVLEASKRAKANDMRLMIDFHYSDHFADPQYQEVPSDWLADIENPEKLEEHIAAHTKDVLGLLKDNGIIPDWVQVGNEINPGLLLPAGSLEEHPKELVGFLNAGYRAVKEVSRDIEVITHVAGLQIPDQTHPFLDNFFANGGLTDILGFSYYPYWMAIYEDHEREDGEVLRNLKDYINRYHKPVMIAEIGEEEEKDDLANAIIKDAIEALKSLPDNMGRGIFYWEPEIGKGVLPDKYPLGASAAVDERTIRFTNALEAYRH